MFKWVFKADRGILVSQQEECKISSEFGKYLFGSELNAKVCAKEQQFIENI